MTAPFNKLTPKQAELLTLLAEECAEVIQAITKIQRHGLNGCYDDGETNIGQLQRELGDVAAAQALLFEAGTVSRGEVNIHRDHKLNRVAKFLHHLEDER